MIRMLGFATVAAASMLLSGCGVLGASAGPSPTEGTAGVVSIAVGDCINRPADDSSGLVVTKIDCAKPHDQEAFSSITMPDGDYPGDAAVKSAANDGCVAAFQDFVGLSFDKSNLSLTAF